MKKERFKGFLSGILAAALIVSLSASVMAAQNISVNGGVKLKIDGQLFTPKDVNGNVVDVFEYNGTTYVPVRAVSQAFEKDVSWDNDTRTVIINSKSDETPAAPSQSFSRTNPAPIGTEQTISIDTIFDQYTAKMTITEVIRGSSAWEKIKAANQFNSEAEDGNEYILAKVKVTIAEEKKGQAVSFYSGSLTAFSKDNVEYPSVFVSNLKPDFSGSVYKGGTLEGYVAFQVDQSDTAPKAVFGADYNGAGGIWFSLTK